MPHTIKVGIWAFSKSANRLEVGGSLSFLFAESCHSMLVMGGVAIIIMLPMGSGSRLHRVTAIPTANERTGIIMPNRADSWIIVRPHAKVMTMNQNMGHARAEPRYPKYRAIASKGDQEERDAEADGKRKSRHKPAPFFEEGFYALSLGEQEDDDRDGNGTVGGECGKFAVA
ncbi:MAG: hypothetical protein V8R48_12275 [Eggerthella lenta]